jgi:hypothetical protein
VSYSLEAAFLLNWGKRDGETLDRILPLIYDELRRLAPTIFGSSALVTPSKPQRSSMRSIRGFHVKPPWW